MDHVLLPILNPLPKEHLNHVVSLTGPAKASTAGCSRSRAWSCSARSCRSSTRPSSTSRSTRSRATSTPTGDDPVGRHRLHARARDRDPDHRLGGRPLRHQAALHALDRPLPRRLGAVRRRLVGRVADRLPRPAGPRRRHADAGRHDDPHPRGRAAARRPRDGDHRRADAARPDPRADPRRLARRRRLLALDLLHQPADRRDRADRSRCASSRGRAAARRAPRRARPRAAVARPRADDLRPRRVGLRRRLRRDRGAGPGARRRRADRRLRLPRAAHAARADRPAPVQEPHVRGRLGHARC